MEYQEAKNKFISTWGSLGSLWGINKAMAQIQALLFISTEALTTEDIMEELQISRGNTSMNVRQLIDWGIVTKELRPGERKEYFLPKKMCRSWRVSLPKNAVEGKLNRSSKLWRR